MTRITKHRSKVLGIVAMVAVVFAGDRLLAKALDAVVMRTGFRYSVLYRGDARGEIVIAGNSRALHALFVRDFEELLGCDAFHVAYNGIPMTLVSAIVQDYLELNEMPERVFVEVTCLGVEPTRSAENFTMYIGDSARLMGLLRRASSRVAGACEVTHLYRFNGEMFTRSLASLGSDDQGWISPSVRVATAEMLAEPIDETFDHFEIHEANVDALRAMLASCDARGVEVTLFVAPFAPGVLEEGMAGGYASRVAGLLGREVHDYSGALDDVSGFSDRVHTNRRGAGELLRVMIERGLVGSCDPGG